MLAPRFCLSCGKKKRSSAGRCERCGVDGAEVRWELLTNPIGSSRGSLLAFAGAGGLCVLFALLALSKLITGFSGVVLLGLLLCLLAGCLLLALSLPELLLRSWRGRAGQLRGELREYRGLFPKGYAVQYQHSEWSPEMFSGFVFWTSARIASHTDSLWRVFAAKLSPASEDTESALRDARFVLLGSLFGLLARDVIRLGREEEQSAWQLGGAERPVARGFWLRLGQKKTLDEPWLERELVALLEEDWKQLVVRGQEEQRHEELLREGVPLVVFLRKLIHKLSLWNGDPANWQKRQRFLAATEKTSFEHWRLVDDIDEFLQERRSLIENLLLQIEQALGPIGGPSELAERRRRQLHQQG